MNVPTFSYSGVQLDFQVGVPLTLTPVQTGDLPSPRLRVTTASGNLNNFDYPKDGSQNVATYKFPNSVSAKADNTLVVIDDWSQTVRVVNPMGVSSTVAGKYELINATVQTGYVDGQGAVARFNSPKAVAFDTAGNMVVLDTSNNRVRVVTPTGVVSTLAGSGVAGTLDGSGTSAQFKVLTSLWIDSSGNIFVTDDLRVRKITPSGVVTTVAGSGLPGSTNGASTVARFKQMRGITGDNAGNLYVSDTNNNSVRKIDASGNVTTLASGINPTGIAFYNNILYVADYLSNQVLNVTLSGVVSVFAGSGVSQFKDGFDSRVDRAAASFYAPEGLAVVGSGSNVVVFVADKNSMKIRKIDSANYSVTPALPEGVSLDSTTGVISGMPTQAMPLTTFTILSGNSAGFGKTIIGFRVN